MARNALIQVRRDTAANWTSVNPTLAAGEVGFETDTNLFKIGTGSTAWNALIYQVAKLSTVTKTASSTLALTDGGKLVEMNVATANNLTIPLNSSVAFPIGTEILVLQIGAGQTTLVATGGVTINSKSANLKIAGQWSAVTLIKRATDTWVAIGDLSA